MYSVLNCGRLKNAAAESSSFHLLFFALGWSFLSIAPYSFAVFLLNGMKPVEVELYTRGSRGLLTTQGVFRFFESFRGEVKLQRKVLVHRALESTFAVGVKDIDEVYLHRSGGHESTLSRERMTFTHPLRVASDDMLKWAKSVSKSFGAGDLAKFVQIAMVDLCSLFDLRI